MTKVSKPIQTVCTNRKALFDYSVLDTLEAGIVLQGTEIKSVRAKKVSLESSYVHIFNGEVWMINSHIDEYENASRYNHEPKRQRKLLLNRKEIKRFAEQAENKGLTIIPLKMYLKDGRAKVEIAVVRGKQLHDKRIAIRQKEEEKQMKNDF